MAEDPLLTVRDLEKHYATTTGWLRRTVGSVRAVDGISFDVHRGETFGLVGESGCGKSTTALTLLRLEEPTGGEIRFDGDAVAEFDGGSLHEYRRRVQFIMQNPKSAFNPRMTVREAVAEPLKLHGMTDSERRERIVAEVLERVGLQASDVDDYPHEFSGGEKQRLALARALVLNPDLIIADEPTSALDGRTKAEVLQLMNNLQRELDLSILLISHDIDLVHRFCDRLAVMYVGKIVERGPAKDVVGKPHHPYTRALMSSVPSLDPHRSAGETAAETLTDVVPDASAVPSGCRFHPRCPAIIAPEDVELAREEWLGVAKLRLALTDGWADADSYLSSIGADLSDVEASVRACYDLPTELSEPEAESAVTDAVAALERNDLEAAREELVRIGWSICERNEPGLTGEHTDHAVACHCYNPEQPGAPLVEQK